MVRYESPPSLKLQGRHKLDSSQSKLRWCAWEIAAAAVGAWTNLIEDDVFKRSNPKA